MAAISLLVVVDTVNHVQALLVVELLVVEDLGEHRELVLHLVQFHLEPFAFALGLEAFLVVCLYVNPIKQQHFYYEPNPLHIFTLNNGLS